MEVARKLYLGLDRISRAARAESLTGLDILRCRIAGLNHELVDDTVKQCAVVIALVDEFYEVVAMQRGVAV